MGRSRLKSRLLTWESEFITGLTIELEMEREGAFFMVNLRRVVFKCPLCKLSIQVSST